MVFSAILNYNPAIADEIERPRFGLAVSGGGARDAAVRLEYGGAWFDRDDINSKNSIGSASVFVAFDSPLGPIHVGMGFTDKGDRSAITRVGRFI